MEPNTTLALLCADQIETSIFPPPSPVKLRAFDYFLCLGVGNLTGKAFRGVGNSNFVMVG